MKQFTTFLFSALVALLVACNGGGTQVASNSGGISGTGDGSGKSSISGASYKGPLIKGSIIKIHKVSDFVVSSEHISSTTLSNKGDFAFELDPSATNNTLASATVTGQYYDENTAQFSNSAIELKALIQLNASTSKQQKFYINSLTHLAHDYSLQLLTQEKTYTEATALAQTRVLTLLAALTGDRNITGPFSNMSLINAPGSNTNDNSFLLYISALLTKATSIKQQTSPTFKAQDLFDTLINNVIDDTAIDDETLTLLQTAHEQLDASIIAQNLASVLVGETIATALPTISAVSPGLNTPTEFHTAAVPSRNLQRFCYDGATDCDAVTVTGEVTNNGLYTYQLQTAVQGSNYAAARVFPTSRNTVSINWGRFSSSTTYDARVRKVWPDGQYSVWTELSFIAPP